MSLTKDDVAQAISSADGDNWALTYNLEAALPVLRVLWEKAPWYVRMLFKLIDAIHDYLEDTRETD